MKFYELLIFTRLDELTHHRSILGEISKERHVSTIFSLFAAQPCTTALSC